MFEILTRQNRYAILFRIGGAKRADTRARKVAEFVGMLARGETIHPQRRGLEDLIAGARTGRRSTISG